jgi:WS/DGAT/MGAT family acyltransferase
MRQLTGQDATFLYLESGAAHLHLTALYVYEQPKAPQRTLRFADIANLITARLDASPLFRQVLVRMPWDLDYPFWVDDPDFDPSRHLLRHTGTLPRSRQQLFDTVAELHSLPLDLDRPPWEMHVLEKLNRLKGFPPACFAIVARYHHAAIDGASGTQLVDGLHRYTPHQPGSGKAPHRRGSRPAAKPGRPELLARAAINNIGNQLKLGKAIGAALPGIARTLLKAPGHLAGKPGKVPDTRFNQAVTAGRVFHACSVSLDEINRIRQQVPGATINDVVLSVCAGGLRSWLDSMKELPPESLLAMVPVNAGSGEEAALGGNHLSAHFLPIRTDIANALDRLQAIRDITRERKAPGHGLSAQETSRISARIPALPLSLAGRMITGLGLNYRLLRLCNCTITNVPGSREALYLGPAKLVFSTGAGPVIDGMGLIISAFSYRDELTFSFTSCQEMLPEPELLGRLTLKAFAQLRAEAGALD